MLELFRDLGVFSLAVAGLAWVAKAVGQHFIDRRFAAYENELNVVVQQQKLSLDRELERHRSDLNFEYLKHSRIHERRLEVMTQLYKLLFRLDESMREVTALLKVGTGEDWEERRKREMKEAHEDYLAFRTCFAENRILLAEDTCALMERLEEEYWESFRIGTFADRWNARGSDRSLDMAHEASEKVREQIPAMRRELEQDFRCQLGAVGAS